MPVKILYVHGIGEIGGAETELLAFLRSLNREVFQPFVACPSDGHLAKEVQALGVPVQSLIFPTWRKFKDRFRIPKAIWLLVKLIRHWKVDVVHVNDYWWGPLVYVASRITGIPIIVHIRQEIEARRIRQYWLSKPDVLFAVSQSIRNVLVSSGLRAEKVHVVYSGIDTSSLGSYSGQTSVRTRYGLRQNQLVVGTVANLFPRKGHEYLIEAMDEVRRTIPDIFCLIVGKGDASYSQSLQDLVRLKNLESNLAFAGFQKNVYEFLAAFDVFVLPSLLEGFGIVLLEAMGMERPIVASRVGGIPEVVDDGVTGYLVSPGNSSELAFAMLKLLEDSQLRRSMGEAGRKRVETCFNHDRTIKNIEGVYQDLV